MLNKIEPPAKKAAKIMVVTDDHGQFGTNYCGNCGANLGNELNVCPECGAIFTGIEPDLTFGGSDF